MAVNKNRTIALLIGRAGVCGERRAEERSVFRQGSASSEVAECAALFRPTLRSELTRQSLRSFAEVTDDPVGCYKATLSPSAR
jgi:hypothetical protein